MQSPKTVGWSTMRPATCTLTMGWNIGLLPGVAQIIARLEGGMGY